MINPDTTYQDPDTQNFVGFYVNSHPEYESDALLEAGGYEHNIELATRLAELLPGSAPLRELLYEALMYETPPENLAEGTDMTAFCTMVDAVRVCVAQRILEDEPESELQDAFARLAIENPHASAATYLAGEVGFLELEDFLYTHSEDGSELIVEGNTDVTLTHKGREVLESLEA